MEHSLFLIIQNLCFQSCYFPSQFSTILHLIIYRTTKQILAVFHHPPTNEHNVFCCTILHSIRFLMSYLHKLYKLGKILTQHIQEMLTPTQHKINPPHFQITIFLFAFYFIFPYIPAKK